MTLQRSVWNTHHLRSFFHGLAFVVVQHYSLAQFSRQPFDQLNGVPFLARSACLKALAVEWNRFSVGLVPQMSQSGIPSNSVDPGTDRAPLGIERIERL